MSFANFFFKQTGEKHCVLTIFATSRALACLEQEMVRVVGASIESANKDKTLFLFLGWIFRLGIGR